VVHAGLYVAIWKANCLFVNNACTLTVNGEPVPGGLWKDCQGHAVVEVPAGANVSVVMAGYGDYVNSFDIPGETASSLLLVQQI